MNTINIFRRAGSFAENKDVARDIRLQKIIPILEKQQNIILDFMGVESATQSFVHTLISDLFRLYGDDVLGRIQFKSCNKTVQSIISIVTSYMQERD